MKRPPIAHLLAAFVAIAIIILDQWTKALVVEHLSPPNSGRTVPLLGEYLALYYIQNKDSAMGLFSNGIILTILIIVAIAVLIYIYLRLLSSSHLIYKLLFAMILGGAIGNVIDRFRHAGVVDFILFSLPQLHFQFYIFNIADAAISVGVVLLLVLALFSQFRKPRKTTGEGETLLHKS